MIFRFTVPGPPVGYQRAGSRAGQAGRFTPAKTREFMKRVEWAWWQATAGKLPAGFEARYIRVMCFFKNGVHPDPDNVKHGVIDALKRRAYAKDDRRIGSSVDWVERDKNPRTEVEVEG